MDIIIPYYGQIHTLECSIGPWFTHNDLHILFYPGEDYQFCCCLTEYIQGINNDKDCAFIDTEEENREIIDWLVSTEIAYPTGRKVVCGDCIFPEYRFDPAALAALDPEGYSKYCSGFNECQNGET